MGDAARKLSGLVKGSFRGVKVIRRGASPRVVAADVVGTRGTTRVTGSTLRARFGLYDTWGYYTSIATKKKPPAEETPPSSRRSARPARAPAASPRARG